jgi:hypothetical protein
MEDAVAITVRAFRERELAANWLGVPLAIPSSASEASPIFDSGCASGRGARVSLIVISYSLLVRKSAPSMVADLGLFGMVNASMREPLIQGPIMRSTFHPRAQRNALRRRDDHRGADLISDAQPRREVV